MNSVPPLPRCWASLPLAAGWKPMGAVSLSPGWAALVLLAAGFAGAIASVAGFGIGSILTPLFSWQSGTKFAVAAVSIPHLAGTAVRFWLLRGHIDRRVLLSFGLASAAGGLLGAF